MGKTLEQRIEKLEKKVAELSETAQPKEEFIPEDSNGKHYECKEKVKFNQRYFP